MQHSYRKPEEKRSTGGDAFNEVDEEMLNNMKKQLLSEMDIMKDRILQALKVKTDEIYSYVDKKADEVRIL